MMEYDFELEKVLAEVKKADAKVVGLQFPEGLKEYAVEVAEEVEKVPGATAVVFTDPVYGACDTKDSDARLLGVDILLHFGHTGFL